MDIITKRITATMDLLAKPRHKLEILLVEDNPADARLVSLALKGFEIEHYLRVVTDGQLAMDYLQKKGSFEKAPRPDIILLDWKLPVKNGGEILKEIRRSPDLRNIPVAIVSSVDSSELGESIYKTGANMFVEKPITLDRFSLILQHLYGGLEQ